MSARCWGVPFGSPGTLCHCSHSIDFHVRQLNNPTGDSICLMCLSTAIDMLQGDVMELKAPVVRSSDPELACYHCGREFKDADVRELHEAVVHEGVT